ncbi:hypothetical protein ABL78_3702 [Leptomonas seymouri]|uniref:Uncharacterized protein n=1 Tax=Leptomonas seymouri TaxID=5684 RepID=A0A0N1HZ78_LEPSE|nr:hypothetical protein ABL78_3702 [Leptomonas seymouri]|eukprot:KPI87232.1 hypothetical protein ABL78_3702 [Leptomonas seymouri]
MSAAASTTAEHAAGTLPNNTSAETATTETDEHEGCIDFSQLHPSVRFYRGVWKLTQLTEDDQDKPPENGEASPSATNALLPVLSPSSPHSTTALSIVALHQRLLPPAPMGGLAEVAAESYAAQLAAPDGIEFLRVHWHLLLPLLFPCSSSDPTPKAGGADTDLESGGVTASRHVKTAYSDNGAASATAKRAGEVAVDGEEEDAEPESRWTAQELLAYIQRPLSEADLKVIREPGHMDRIYYSYIVLLRFFGWRVHDEERGLLDRHRAWAERYAQLELYRSNCACGEPALAASSPGQLPPPPTYARYNFYEAGLQRVLRGLLEVGFLRLAVRLVEFLMEEMKSDRLLFLLPLVEFTLLPLVVECENVEASHKARLKKHLHRLMHSDSD